MAAKKSLFAPPRKKCPVCNSSKINGTKDKFYCEMCGYRWHASGKMHGNL